MTAAMRAMPNMRTPAGALKYAKTLRGPDERMFAVWCDDDGKVINTTMLAPGHLDVTQDLSKFMVEMVKAGQAAGATKAFLVHNDPSNDLATDEGTDIRGFTQQVPDAVVSAHIG